MTAINDLLKKQIKRELQKLLSEHYRKEQGVYGGDKSIKLLIRICDKVDSKENTTTLDFSRIVADIAPNSSTIFQLIQKL